MDQPESASPNANAPAKKPGIIRRMYNWTLGWADHPHALPILFAISFIESSFFPIPPDVLLIALCFSKPQKWAKLALWCTIGSVLGGVFGWWIGHALYDPVGVRIINIFDPERHAWGRVEEWYKEYGFLGILIAAITPIPYKVFTIASGFLHYSLPMLIVASIIGRGFRFFLVAWLIHHYGAKIRPFIEKYLEWVLLAVTIVGVGGFVALKYLK
jgi:membrane protein YqaA with SNARE-associated domain